MIPVEEWDTALKLLMLSDSQYIAVDTKILFSGMT